MTIESEIARLNTTNTALTQTVVGIKDRIDAQEQNVNEDAQSALEHKNAAQAAETGAGNHEAQAKVEADRAKSEADNVASVVTGGTASLDSEAGKIPLADAEGKIDSDWLKLDHARSALEAASGGKNTIIVDAQGNENVMVRIPRFNYEDINQAILDKYGVDMQLGTGVPTMFTANGVAKKEVLIAKYLASSGINGGCAVVGGVQPRTSINYDAAKALCENKGAGWHMMSIHEWAAIALWSIANETIPRGNTNYGRSHEQKTETATRYDDLSPGDTAGTARTGTGTGPAEWSHDHTNFGIQDLVGNVYEWLDQMQLQDGRIIATSDNDTSIAEADWPEHDAYLDAVNGVELAPSVTNRQGTAGDDVNSGYSVNDAIADVTHSAGYIKNELLRRLLIELAGKPADLGRLYVRNYGNRLPLRGGLWSNGSYAGLGSLNLINSRSGSSSYIGVRPAFFAS